MIEIEAEELAAPAAYKLLVGIVVPRPIAWVSTVNASGRVNLAPFSCYTFVSNDPPMLAVSVGRRDGTPKDTARNARQCGEFVVNVVDEALVSPMHLSSAEHPPEEGEADHLGIELAPSALVRPPRVAAAPAAMECRLDQVIEFGNLRSQLLVGRILRFYVAERLYRDGRVDPARLRPLARLGGPNYAGLGEILTMPAVGDAGPSDRRS